MRKTILIGSLLIAISGYAQVIHTPVEILQLLTNSKVKYKIQKLDKTIECKDYSKNLNYHDCYRVTNDSTIETFKYTINDDALPSFNKAEEYFKTNLDSALSYYHSALIMQPSLYMVMTYIGQVCEKKGNLSVAMEWYKTAINKNYIDYMAHWFLADAYESMGDLDKALDEIVIAQILNRNNSNIKTSMTRILKKAKRSTEDWYFTPQIKLSKDSDNTVNLAMNEKWFGYGMAKALWDYEPGYRESMGVSEGYLSSIECKECLASQYISLKNAKAKTKKDPQLQILQKAVDKKFLDQYIIYELFLPQNPFIANQLSEKTILSIKNYILEVRNK